VIPEYETKNGKGTVTTFFKKLFAIIIKFKNVRTTNNLYFVMQYTTEHPVSCFKACIAPLNASNTKYNDVRNNYFTRVLCFNESLLELKVKSTDCKYVIAKEAGMSLEAIYRVYQNNWSGFEVDYIHKYGEQNYEY
jgi:hypothetical protein